MNPMCCCVLWKTGVQRRRLALFGDVVFFDATAVNVEQNFQLFLPSILNNNKKLLIVCCAVVETENTAGVHFILQSMRQQTLFMDSKFSPSARCCSPRLHLALVGT
eukprot:c6363_g1_i1.p2 GENE.c6363_g1_i1~~c6363_g1_i1.p2  ORF type:complete len:106 (+),score=9.87 c6363_g1_i1:288-605(+)